MDKTSHVMDLQLLDFDCSEDAEGVVCWDALAQPAARHTHALLQEVSQVLGWAHGLGRPGPGPLEDGADWDFDVQVRLLGPDSTAAHAHWDPAQRVLQISPQPGANQSVVLSLSLSGTPGFAHAFRAHWNAP
jgi:hypothetical protein